MKTNYLLLILTICIAGCGTPGKQVVEKPNIVFIMVDDLGWKDVGFMGGEFFNTPNIDKLAGEGMVFTNSYASASNCAPSRACLMTGQNTPRHGIYTVSPSARGKSADRKIIPITNTDSIAFDASTMAKMFKAKGYVTGTFGKWHLNSNPKIHGFDVNKGGGPRGNPGFGNPGGYFSPYNVPALKDGPKGEHLTDRLTSEAIKFVEENRNNPFFLYLPYYSVHTPIQAKKEIAAKYKDRQNENHLGTNPAYAAMVETTDINIGRLLGSLKELGLEENTIVIFTSDNGGLAFISPQLPLRAGKGSYYEGGIRVPTIVKWPGKIKAGTQNHTPITHLDYFPTFKEIIQSESPNTAFDGMNILPLWYGETMDERPLFWHFPIYLEACNARDDARDPKFRTRPGSVVRMGDWKLHQYYEDNEIELFNLKADIGERNNLAKSHPEKTEELLNMLKEWRINTNAPVPTQKNSDYEH